MVETVAFIGVTDRHLLETSVDECPRAKAIPPSSMAAVTVMADHSGYPVGPGPLLAYGEGHDLVGHQRMT